MPLFSIIIPCYNASQWIQTALESVSAQSGDDFEVIAVDDGSTDDTLTILNAYGRGLRVLSQSNQGAGAARNYAISQAKGDYIAFLDADDVWFPWTLAIFRESIAEFGWPSIIAGTSLRFKMESELRVVGALSKPAFQLYANFYEAAADGFWFLLQGALAVKRGIFETCGGYAERRMNSEDTHLFMKFGMAPGFAAVRAPALFGYRMHEGNAIHKAGLNKQGCLYLIAHEKSAGYPGGKPAQPIRRRVLAIQARAASVGCIKHRDFRGGWKLYTETFGWHLLFGRIKYLIGFPIFLAAALITQAWQETRLALSGRSNGAVSG